MAFDRAIAKEFLLDLARILEGLKIPFFLMQGTALGAYRDHNFTPTEGDVDIGVLIEHLVPNLGDLVAAITTADYGVETHGRFLPFRFCHTLVVNTLGWPYNDGAKADIVGWHKWKEWRFARCPYDPASIRDEYSIVHNHWMIETTEQVELFGHTFNIPSPAEQYFSLEYGDDWRTPRQDSISRTRVYNFVKEQQLPDEFFSTKPESVSRRT